MDGTHIVELCQNVAGPYAGFILASLGADVVKVERPLVGDDARAWGPPFVDGSSPMFAVMNRGKESISLDLTDPVDRESLWTRLRVADAVVETWRPGKLDDIGFGYEAVKSMNPGVVYCSISAFGEGGPMSSARGYDPLIQAMSGLMSITGHDSGPPVRVGTSIIDMASGMWAALAIVSALKERERTGRGSRISTSLLETGIAWLPYQIAQFMETGVAPRRLGSGLAMLSPYGAFETQDSFIVIAVGNDRMWRSLCQALERDDLGSDHVLASNEGRVHQRDRITREIERTLIKRETQHWVKVLESVGVPSAPLLTIPEAVDHIQVKSLDMIRAPVTSGYREVGLPMRFDGERPWGGRTVPPLQAPRNIRPTDSAIPNPADRAD